MTPEPAIMYTPREASNFAVHSLTVLETKLYSPKWRQGLVSRSRLIERIRQGAEHALTLISAPAGFGKTTLLAEWLAQRPAADAPAGWVSLDRSENESALFWAYVIRALQKVQPGFGASPLAMLQSFRQPPTEIVLTSLINEINAIDRDFILILDDYHVIDAPQVHAGVTFFLDHLPPRMRLIIASRSDPLVPLPRLRARGQVTELRAADLRFTPDEASAFLNQVMALDLSATDVSTLELRTEGWIAGLKLAALSLKNRADVQKFIRAFSGDNRYIADYLIQEVLLAQPESVRRFLLGTAILDWLSGPLCDAVTGEHGSQAQLESLETSNLFVIPLDDTRECYRYHHLFAEVLRAHSIRENPDGVRTLHRRASIWFEANGSHADAVHHAAAADDVERVAGLLETRWPSMDRSYQTGKWLERVKALPDALVRKRPVLNTAYAWVQMNAGELEAAEARLSDVDLLLQTAEQTGDRAGDMIVVDEKRFAFLGVQLSSARAYLAQARGEVVGTVEHARRLLDTIPDGEHTTRATATALLSLAQWAHGELDEACATFTVALSLMRKAGNSLDAIRGEFVPADIRVAQGRLREAEEIYEAGLQLAKDSLQSAAAETDELYLGLSELHREWGDLDGATRLLQTITESAGRTEHVGNRRGWCTSMARVAESRGDLPGALRLLDEAERVDVRTPLPRLRPISAARARIWIVQGKLREAIRWANEQKLSVEDDLSYAREYEHITLVRLLIARYVSQHDESTIRDALMLLERLLIEASRGGRKPAVIEILLLEALAHNARSNTRAALDAVERALQLGESEGYLRIFVDEGPIMRELLRHAAARGSGGEYTRNVLRGFDGPTSGRPVRNGVPVSAGESVATARPVAAADSQVQSLTARELEILRLIAAGLRNQEIADQLSISTPTVKRHVANAYAKLDVSHRTEALVRAHALNLL
ncbi:MAG: LuxR C-terminal-related transcriptional regulator [bacterium]